MKDNLDKLKDKIEELKEGAEKLLSNLQKQSSEGTEIINKMIVLNSGKIMAYKEILEMLNNVLGK